MLVVASSCGAFISAAQLLTHNPPSLLISIFPYLIQIGMEMMWLHP